MVPDVEWWDAPLLANKSYNDIVLVGELFNSEFPSPAAVDAVQINLNTRKITNLVEHPVPVEEPIKAPEPAPKPVMLTAKVCDCSFHRLLLLCFLRPHIFLNTYSRRFFLLSSLF